LQHFRAEALQLLSNCLFIIVVKAVTLGGYGKSHRYGEPQPLGFIQYPLPVVSAPSADGISAISVQPVHVACTTGALDEIRFSIPQQGIASIPLYDFCLYRFIGLRGGVKRQEKEAWQYPSDGPVKFHNIEFNGI